MTKTRALQLLSVTASAAIVGCTANELQTPATLAPDPGPNLVFADTTQPVRDWPRTTSQIANGDTVDDGPTGFRWRSADNLPGWQYPLVEPGIFVGNVVTAPYTLIAEQNQEHVSAGLQFPPSYTMMPPYPTAPAAPEAPEPPPVVAPASSEETSPSSAAELSAATQPAIIEHAENRPDEVLIRSSATPQSPAFTISGQVLRPGTYSVGQLKLSQAVVAAAPATEDHTKVRVTIDRPGEDSATTTLDQLLTGAVEDVTLKNNDSVTISVAP